MSDATDGELGDTQVSSPSDADLADWQAFKTRIGRVVSKKMVGFSSNPPEPGKLDGLTSSRPEGKQFPVPELVLFLCRDILGWRWYGAGEKVRWTVMGTVEGEPVAFELRKFGFTICLAKNSKVSLSRIEGQLSSAIKVLEPFLQPIAAHQLDIGDVLIVNRDGEFRTRYRFFRQQADAAFKKAARKPRLPKTKGSASEISLSISATLNHVHGNQRIGFFNSTAMVDAYFSALEHRLVLLRAFKGQPLAVGELETFLASKWDAKLNAVLPTPIGREGELLLGALRRIKERIRNPFAHGGSENDRGSIFFHFPRIGPIPANFTRFGQSVRFSFLPVGPDDYKECCETFDALDVLLSTGTLSGPHRLVDAGVDPSFDSASLTEYRQSVEGEADALEAWIDAWGHAWERHANMDY